MASCAECKNEGKQICTVCSNYMGVPDRFEPKPQTNADRLRAMSDEEMAEYLDHIAHDLFAMFVADPKKMWLDWLREKIV